MQQFKIRFILRTEENSEGKHLVFVRIHLNGERKFLTSTDISVKKKDWDSVLDRCKLNTVEGRMINNKIETLQMEILYIFRRHEFDPNLSLDLIKAEYQGGKATNSQESSFMNHFRDYVELRRIEDSTIKHDMACYYKYAKTLRHFTSFLKDVYKRTDIKFSELDYPIIYAFEKYLRKNISSYCCNNTIIKKMHYLRTVINDARKKGLITRDPFYGIKFQQTRVDRGFLEDKDIMKLIEAEFYCERLEQIRDFFLFGCFTGLAYIDIKNLTKDNIVVLNGRRWIIKRRQKTDVASNIPLLPMAESILEKYNGRSPDGRHLIPIPSNQKVNMYLKEVAFYCGIEKRLTFHMARHTFATLTLTKGVSIESVSKMLGHTNIRTTQLYARITPKKIEQDMLDFESKIGGFGTTPAPAAVTFSPHIDAVAKDEKFLEKKAAQSKKVGRGRPRKNQHPDKHHSK